jgi:hypothetical protein
MSQFLLKCFFVSLFSLSAKTNVNTHPIFMTITELEYNSKEKLMEISCKLFTDDFERALRATTDEKVDLMDGLQKVKMNKLVEAYMQKHLQIQLEGKNAVLKFLGFEIIEEGTYCYFEITNIGTPKKIVIVNDLLYEYKKEQLSLLHVTVNSKRQSTKLTNPVKMAEMNF